MVELEIDPRSYQLKRDQNLFGGGNNDGDAGLCSLVCYALVNLVGVEEENYSLK
jgi:hypothetical protein